MPPVFLKSRVLRKPAQRGVRLVARARLQRTLEEAARVELAVAASPTGLPVADGIGAADPEAIHDFRVALRRLRAWLRAFRPCFADTVRPAPKHRLRAISRLAGRARDLEVQFAWLTETRPALSAPVAEAARRVATKLARKQASARRDLARSLVKDLPRAGARLARQLQHYRADPAVAGLGLETMAGAMAQALRQATDALRSDLGQVKRAGQIEAAHAARIAIKRLRYLLDAFGPHAPRTAGILPRLVALQHLFGELHDAQMLQHQLPKASRGRGAGPPAPRAAAGLRRVLERRKARAFRQVYRATRSHATAMMFTRVALLIRRLETGR